MNTPLPPQAAPAPLEGESWKQRIPSLDGLRGLAILMVLVGHGLHVWEAPVRRVLKYAGNGPLGVNIFFVLSGFLIHNLSAREIRKTGTFNWKMFYLRRVLRIFPCFYLYIGTLLVLTSSGLLALTWQMLLAASTFSLNYRHLWDPTGEILDYVVIGHYWTLALEEQFYLTWPLLILLFMRRKLLPVLVVILVAAPFVRLAFYFLTPGSRGYLGSMFHTGFDAIAAGVLLGEMMARPALRATLLRLAANRFLLAACLVFMLLLSPVLGERLRGAYTMTAGKSLELLAICVVIVAAVSFPGSMMFRILNWKPLAFIGVLSYSLYVWNNLFLLGHGHWFNAFPFNYLCVAGAGLLSYYLVEKPFLRLKDRFHTRASG